jgi:hypothetical protein
MAPIHLHPRHRKPIPPKPVKKFWLSAYTFSVEEAGPIREPLVGLSVSDGTNWRFCVWISSGVILPGVKPKVTARDWAVFYNKDNQNAKETIYSGMNDKCPPTHYQVLNPITIDELVPDKNQTQIAIAKQMKDSFLVRFIIADGNDQDKERQGFMVEYPGVVPGDLIGKPFWGALHKEGDSIISPELHRALPATSYY